MPDYDPEIDEWHSRSHRVIPPRLSFWHNPRPTAKQALENLWIAQYQTKFEELAALHRQIPGQVQKLLAELETRKSLDGSATFVEARKNLSRMNSLLGSVYARHKVRRGVINAITAFDTIHDSSWDHPAVRERVAQMLQVLEREFRSYNLN
jgi:hypothetical protein